jgi:hypothetical protein
MPNLAHADAIKEYWDIVKDNYPNITFEQFETVCKSPPKAIKQWIKNGDLPIIHVKYLGKIMVYKGTIIHRIKDIQRKYDLGYIPEHIYTKEKQYLEDYLVEILREEKQDSGVELIDNESQDNTN